MERKPPKAQKGRGEPPRQTAKAAAAGEIPITTKFLNWASTKLRMEAIMAIDEIDRCEAVILRIEAYVTNKDVDDGDPLYETARFWGEQLIDRLKSKIHSLLEEMSEPRDYTVANFIDNYIATHGVKPSWDVLMERFG